MSVAYPPATGRTYGRITTYRIRRKHRRQRFRGFSVTSMQTRQVYSFLILTFGFVATVSALSWWLDFNFYIVLPAGIQVLFILGPMWTALGASVALLTLLWMYRTQPQLYAGEADGLPFLPGANESLMTKIYRDNPEEGKGNTKFLTWHLTRGNVIFGNHLRLPWGPFVIAPVTNKEYDATLLARWHETGNYPDTPAKDWVERLRSYTKIGRRYEILGPIYDMYVLGNHDDGLEWARKWVWRTFPKASPAATVIVIADSFPGTERLQNTQPGPLTNAGWMLAEAERQNEQLRAKLMEASTFKNVLTGMEQGGMPPLPPGEGS